MYTFPDDGDYVLRLRHIQQVGGKDYAYRLVIAPPRPDYSLQITPDVYRLTKGDTIALTVKTQRRDGFGGEIALAAKNLPPGFTASEAVIPAGQEQTRLTISAPPDAPVGLVTPIIVGTATIGETTVIRTAVPSEDIRQAFSLRHIVPTKELILAVLEAVGLTLTTTTPPGQVLEVQQGGEVTIMVKAARICDGQGPVTLTLDAPPPGITVKISPAVIPADRFFPLNFHARCGEVFGQ